jgi:GT2 family glycosyltransferase
MIRAASGEYIAFLHSDTIVSRGWLTRFLKHLQNEDIGIVGPATNLCGNEAKIEVPYQTIEQMEEFAEDYLQQHMEPVGFDLEVLAMFCVAVKRRILEEVGGFDERSGTVLFEDDNFSRRVRSKGYRVFCAQDVFIHHFGEHP